MTLRNKYEQTYSEGSFSMLQIKKLLFGLVASLALTAALLAAFSALILKLGALPGEIAGTIALAIGCVSVFAAAFFTARIAGEKGLLHGLVLAAVYVFSVSGRFPRAVCRCGHRRGRCAHGRDPALRCIGRRSRRWEEEQNPFLSLYPRCRGIAPASLCISGFHNNILCLYISLHKTKYIKQRGLQAKWENIRFCSCKIRQKGI